MCVCVCVCVCYFHSESELFTLGQSKMEVGSMLLVLAEKDLVLDGKHSHFVSQWGLKYSQRQEN